MLFVGSDFFRRPASGTAKPNTCISGIAYPNTWANSSRLRQTAFFPFGTAYVFAYANAANPSRALFLSKP